MASPKEEIQKLAAQIEFSKIVAMEVHNRHLKPKPGGYFSQATAVTLQSPLGGAGAGIRTTTAAASAFSAPHPGTLGLGGGNNGGLFRGRNSMGDESLASSTSPAASAEALGSVGTGLGAERERVERLDRV